MKRIYISFAALLLGASCATMLDGTMQQVSFDSNEPDVQIFINGSFACKTPCIYDIRRKKAKVMITAKKQGFNDRTMFLEGNLNSTSVINVISLWTSTFGFSTDMSSGTIWMYQPNAVYVAMNKEPTTTTEKQALEKQNKIRRFVLQNFEQLQNDAFSDTGSKEYIKTLAAMAEISEPDIQTVLLNAYAGSDAAERIVGLQYK